MNNPAPREPQSSPIFLPWLAVATFVVVAFAAVLSIVTIRQGEDSHRQQALIATENLCRLLEHDVAHIIGKADQGLQTVVREAEQGFVRGRPDNVRLDAVRAYQHSLLPALLTLRIADAQGDVRWGLDAAHSSANIADREYFSRARDTPRGGLVIAGPLLSRTTGQWVVFLARRIERPDGAFAGIVYGAIAVEHFRKLFSEMRLGRHGAISLRTGNLALVARFSNPQGGTSAIGSSNVSPQLKEMLQTHPLSGTYIAKTALDQIERANSYRKVADYPFIILVGLATDDYLENWRRDVAKILILAGLLILATLISAWSIHRSWQRLRTGEAERHARQAAEAASQAKNRFLAAMSHELRTPLNGILGYAQILRRAHGLSERQAAGLDTILQSGRHLLTLINDLLDLAKIEAGKLELQPQAVNLAAFLPAVADIVRVPLEEKNLAFACEISPELPGTVLADEKRLRQVLLNLLSNAIKFTDRGQVSLRVHPLARDTATVRLRFEVADTGVGMAPQQLQRLFQPFEQLGDARQRSGGTGLGLAISRQLVRKMGSDIQVESTPGQGSRFWFDIALPATDADAAAAAPPAPRRIAGYAGRRRKVLVADDVAGNREMLIDFLGGVGFEACEAADGREAVAKAQALQPDLVLMDLVMPVMDGIEAIRRIRREERGERLPIVVLSASAGGEERAESLAAGADAFLPKPIDQDSLLQAIGRLLALQWHETPAPAPREESGESILPSRPELEILHRLALTGNMRDIREYAVQLAGCDRRYRPFTDQVQQLARNYQSKAILQLIEKNLS